MQTNDTGWENGYKKHFDEIVDKYDKMRTDYPAELFDAVLAYCGPTHRGRAVEIGAGTGKATLPFLRAGFAVTAVELGENMCAFLKQRFGTCPGFAVVNGAFEEAELPEGQFDLAYAASAFHWVKAEVGCPKLYHLLKPGGVAALFRYNMLPTAEDASYQQLQQVYEQCYYTHYQHATRPVRPTREALQTAPEIRKRFGFDRLEDYGFTDVEMRFYERQHSYTAEEYIALLDTLSDHRALPEENRQALYEGIRRVIGQNGGTYHVDYLYQLYMGRK